jgi:hypothetical protein
VFSRTNKPNGTFKEQSMEFRTDNTSIGWDYVWRTGSSSTQIIEQDIIQQDAIGTGTVQWKLLDNGQPRVVLDLTSTLTRDLFDLYAGIGLRIRNSLNADYVEMYHDGLDFQIDCTNTTDFKINEIQNFDLSHSTLAPKLRFNSVVGDKVHWYSTTYFTGVESGTLYHGAGVHRFYSGDAPDAGVSSTFDIGNTPYFFRMRPKDMNTTTDQIAIDLSYTVNKVTSGNDTAIRIQKTDTASAGTSRFLDFYTGGIRQFSILDDGQVLLKSEADAVTPTLAFGDGDTGFYEVNDDLLGISFAGTSNWRWADNRIESLTAGGAYIKRTARSLTNPVFAFATDNDTGIGGGDDTVSLVAGGVEAVSYTEVGTDVIVNHEANVGLTADVGSAQGNGVITSTYNVYSTVATTGDAATLPAAFSVGTMIYVKNDGANSMDVFPASGDDAGAGLNTAVAVAAGDFAVFMGTVADTTWTKIAGGTA